MSHPDDCLPDCMMPDGGEACAGYRHARADIARLTEQPSEQSIERARKAFVKALQDAGCWERQVRHCAVHDFRAATRAAIAAALDPETAAEPEGT